MINLTVPHTALAGGVGAGEVAGFGILDQADTRDLLAAAAREPGDPVVPDRPEPRRDRRHPPLRRRNPPAGLPGQRLPGQALRDPGPSAASWTS